MAKPMLVTAPLVLLLLDFWPLKRFTARDFGRPNFGLAIFRKLVRKRFPGSCFASLPA